MRRGDLMTDYDLIFKEEFFKSKAFNEWHDSLSDIMKFIRETIQPELKPKTDKTEKERALEYKTDIIINSIRLGVYYNKLIEEKEGIVK